MKTPSPREREQDPAAPAALPPGPEFPKGPIIDQPAWSPFPIVGLGASAGGLEALSQLLSELSPDTGMAFILVQHLDPRHESQLAHLLSRRTTMPVLEAETGLAVKPNHVYVIPPNFNMALVKGTLHLAPRDGRRLHLPIDYLFRSLAEDQQGRAIAVVLSGTGSDGTQGVCEIKAVGGITFAQDEQSATHTGMPCSASDSGCIDFVLTPQAIAERLGAIGTHPYLAPVRLTAYTEPSAEENYRKILETVHAVTGVDFNLYRDTTIKRRILRRMAIQTQESLPDYVARLKSDPAEVDALYRDLLINVTAFFRDPEFFETLKSNVFPEIVNNRPPNQTFRIWVPGCSTGQEAYSLAIALTEFMDGLSVRAPVQIFATDISEQSILERARAGVYPEGIEGEISAERLRRFFKRDDHVYRIDKSIRDMCVFAHHNVTADPPFSHLDLVSCRNVLIYLTTPLQKRILPIFHYALNLPGFLVLGSAETVGEHTDLFDLKDRGHRIYAKKATPTRQHLFFAVPDRVDPTTGRRMPSTTRPAPDFNREADRIVLNRFGPPGVVIDENFNVIQFRGRTSAYLEVPPGEPTTSVLKMAREGIFLELRKSLNEARKSAQTVRRDQVRVRSNGGDREIELEVIPMRPPGGGTSYLVLFHEAGAGLKSATETRPDVAAVTEGESGREIMQLRQELAATREYLQSMVEQQDAANEELRSANEEILSSNEELQSTNEELETAKEELQSTNEELTTVNEQLQRRSQEVDIVNSDLTNLLSSTNIPVVMVGPDLRIRRFTPPAKQALRLAQDDIGRSITDTNLGMLVPDVETLIGDIIERAQPVERDVQDMDGRWHILRATPYRTSENKLEGAVLILIDIDQLRRSEDDLRTQAERLRQQATLIDLSLDAIVVRDTADRIVAWNRGAQLMYGWPREDALGQEFDRFLQLDAQAWADLTVQLERTGAWEGEQQAKRRDGSAIVVQSREVLIRDSDGHRAAVLAIHRDMTELRRALDALRDANQRKDEFLAILAHELRNPLGPVRNALEILRLAGNDSSTVDKTREVMDRQVSQLTRIVEDLIDLTRITERKVSLQKETVAMGTVVEMAVETCRSLIENRQVALHVDLPRKTLYLHADPARICQVLVNLLTNSAKFTEPGGEVWLTVEQASTGAAAIDSKGEASEMAVVRVRDNGIGIAPDLLPRVFDMFTQGSRGTRQPSGLGVGLTLVHNLVQMHGGTVEAHSDGPNHGSEFVLQLPLAPATPTEPEPTESAAKAHSAECRVLVVDDNSDQAESLTMLLQLIGHDVRTAFNGEDALQIASEFRPDVMLVDIGLPGMNGHTVARRIRADPRLRDVLLVAQTGWGQEEDRRRSREAGFDHHLVKPVSVNEIEDLLRARPKR